MLDFLLRPFRKNFIGFDKYRKHGAYHWKEMETNSDYRSLIERVVPFLNPEYEVLDIGCGDGAYLGFVANRIKFGTGIDGERVAIELAKKMFKQVGIANCEVHHHTIHEADKRFSKEGKKFDFIWSLDVIEHLPDPDELPRVAAKLLRNGGHALIGTPLFISKELASPYHVKEFTKGEIRSILSAHFRILSEQIVSQTRKDKKVYAESYYLAYCEPIR